VKRYNENRTEAVERIFSVVNIIQLKRVSSVQGYVETLNCNLAYGYRIFFSRQKVSRLKLLAGRPNFPVFLQAYYERNLRFLTSML